MKSLGMITTLALAAVPASHALSQTVETKPNILVILSDDQGFADAGFQGSRDIRTPNLDRLAASGLRCTNGYVTHSYCSPSRAGLLTGRYQARFGYERNPRELPDGRAEGVPVGETMFPAYLAKAGYATGWIGKWHLGGIPGLQPQDRGFTETFGFLGGGHMYQNWKVNPGGAYTQPILRNGKPEDVKEHLTLVFGHEAAAFVKRHQEQPWFLYLAFNAPHTPHQPTAERLAKFSGIKDKGRRAYAAQISLMDDAIGETLDALRASGQDKRTIVFFFSDNGGPSGGITCNAPLRGYKGTYYEGGIHVPFLVSWPGHLPEGKDYAGTVSSLDVAATSLAQAGVSAPTEKPLDGVNLIPFLSGAQSGTPHQKLFWRENSNLTTAMRAGDAKFVRHNTNPAELYDLKGDLGETQDRAAAELVTVAALQADVNIWMGQMASHILFKGLRGKSEQDWPKESIKESVPGKKSEPTATTLLPKPSPVQLAWQDLDFGVMFHYDPRVFNKGGQSGVSSKPRENAAAYAAKFNPGKLDTDQWVAAAKALGANYAILVVKHESGFCLWQSDANPYGVRSIPWRGGKADILKDFIASCAKYGLKPGIFTENRFDGRLGVNGFKVCAESTMTQEAYEGSIERELEELCTRYGELCEIWYDGGCGPMGAKLEAIAAKYQPKAAFYSSPDPKVRTDYRWGGTESGMVQYPCWATMTRGGKSGRDLLATGDPNGKDWLPARGDVPFRCEHGTHHWFYVPGGDKGIASLDHLKHIYYGSVGRNAKTIIGFVPNLDGVIEDPDVARCKEFGAWLEKTLGGKPLAETSGRGTEFTLEIPAGNPTPVTHIVLQEEISNGERVRGYSVEAEDKGVWKQVGSGSCIGHKRIETIQPCAARKFRLHVTQSIAEPELRLFSVR